MANKREGLDHVFYREDWGFRPWAQWVQFAFPRLLISAVLWQFAPNLLGIVLIVLVFGFRIPGDFEAHP